MRPVYIVVKGESELGYTEQDPSSRQLFIWVLAVDHMRGGDPFHIGECVPCFGKDLRPARASDGDRFRIRLDGYVRDSRYVLEREG